METTPERVGPIRRALSALGTLVPWPSDWRAMGWRGVGAALLSAALMTLAFPQWNLWPLAWVGLAPLFIESHGKDPRTQRWLWYLFGVAWFYAALWWFNVTAYVNVMIYAGTVLMALTLALCVLLFAWGAVWMRRLGTWGIVLLPMWWVVTEWVRHFTDMAMPWLFLAHSQWMHPPLFLGVDTAGWAPLSALIFAANLIFAEAHVAFWKPAPTRRWAATVAAVIAAAAVALFGFLCHLAPGASQPTSAPSQLTVALVQPAWDQRDKLAALGDVSLERDLLMGMADLMLREIEPGSVDVILLPESVVMDFYYPISPRSDQYTALLENLALRLDAPIVFGANRAVIPSGIDITRGDQPDVHNSVHVMTPDGPGDTYDKVHLVAFSETAPLVSAIPGLMELTLGNIALFVPGEGAVPLEVPLRDGRTVRLGSHVCFESAFGAFTAGFAEAGADLLVTHTNDAWFLDSAGPWQHWSVQPFRAAEAGRWSLQVANTGVTSVIDPTGRVVSQLPFGEPGVLVETVELRTGATLYSRHGDWLAALFAALCLASVAASVIRARHARVPQESPPQP